MYRRYMVFKWTTYDNVEPFQCVVGSFKTSNLRGSKMNEKAIHGGIGNIVIAGDKIYAGVDEDDRCECQIAVVIEFNSKEEMRKALKSGYATFTLFETNTQHMGNL